jgi:hypothetical protein
MTKEHRQELLAQAIWRAHFGELSILPEWLEFAEKNPEQAKACRDKAAEMLAVDLPNPQYSSLGWLHQ